MLVYFNLFLPACRNLWHSNMVVLMNIHPAPIRVIMLFKLLA